MNLRKFGALSLFRLASIIFGLTDIGLFILLNDDGFQSFYYSVFSIVGFQALFELGVITVIQSWSSLTFSGEYRGVSHLSIKRFTFLFSVVSSLLFFSFSLPYLFFLIKPFLSDLVLPILFVFLSSILFSISFFNTFFFALRVGAGDLSRVYLHRTFFLILSKIFFVLLFFWFRNFELILVIPFLQAFLGVLSNFTMVRSSISFDLKGFRYLFVKFWGLQRKLMLSWAGGFMLFNSTIPTMHFAGVSSLVGQFGLTFAALQGVLSIATVLMSSQLPTVSLCYKNGDLLGSIRIFKGALIFYFLIFVLGVISLGLFVYYFDVGRFLDIDFFILLCLIVFLNGVGVIINEFIRAHAEDLSYIASFVAGLVMILNCFLFLFHGSFFWFLACFCLLFFVLICFNLIAMRKCFDLYGA